MDMLHTVDHLTAENSRLLTRATSAEAALVLARDRIEQLERELEPTNYVAKTDALRRERDKALAESVSAFVEWSAGEWTQIPTTVMDRFRAAIAEKE